MTIAGRDSGLRLTGPDVARVTFPKAPWNRKGYDPEEVDAFLGRLGDELTRRDAYIAGLIAEAERLRRIVAQLRGGGVWLSDPEEAHAAAVRLYSEVQLAADDMIARAQERSAQLTEDATMRLEQAQAEAEQVLADARTQARDAALAVLDEPVPEHPTGTELQAARAGAAYERGLITGYLDHAEADREGELQVIRKIREALRRSDAQQAAEPEPGAGEAQPAG